MDTTKTYEPTRCANTECAYPTLTCSKCRCNKKINGKAAQVVKSPNTWYKWVRKLQLKKLL